MMGPEPPSGFSPSPSSSSPSIYRSAIDNNNNNNNPFLFPSSSSSSSSSSFLDPPSYADAIFRPIEPQIITRPTSANANPSSASDYLEISVSDPQKEPDPSSSLLPGAGSFVTYLITTRPRAGAESFSVRRRFRDFLTLSDRLAESFRGFFLPIRPDKNLVDGQVMQKHEFLEQRRAALEKYLRRVAAHPAAGRSEELRVFLRVQGKLPLAPTTDVASRVLDGAVRLPRQLFGEGAAEAPQEAAVQRGGRDLLRMFKELKQSVANDWGGAKPLLVEEDKEFLERRGKIQELGLQLSATAEQAEALVKAQHDTGETMGELGLAFIKLIKLENDEAIYVSQRVGAADAKIVATAAVKASRFYRELNSQTIKHLDTLHEYMGLMLSIRNAFSERSDALLTVQTLLSDLTSLRVRAEKLEAASARVFGRDESRIQKLEEIRRTVVVTEDAKDCATREYERIKENNRNELERFDKERHDDFLSMLRGLAINQAGYFEKIADVWGTVARETSHYAKDDC